MRPCLNNTEKFYVQCFAFFSIDSTTKIVINFIKQVEVADVDGKGVIDYEAFATLLTAHRS